MSPAAIDTVRRLEAASLADRPQVVLPVDHVLHAGLYARTVTLPASALITGVEIKIATLLIVQGDVVAYTGDGERRYTGYNVLTAAAGRKQAFYAFAETRLTMIFPTQAKTVAEAEAEFTDETHMLQSRRAECQA
jgi:hypothetical protein